MVVRLGQTSDVAVVNSQRYRLKQGQTLSLSAVSNAIVTIRAWARVRYDNGEDAILFIPDQTISNDRTIVIATPSDVARMDGWVVDALVELPIDLDVKRGQVYIKLFMDPFGPVLCSDYVYSKFGQVALGTYIQAGPGGGAGNLEILTIKDDSVPVVTTSYIWAQFINEIVKVYGFAWYYTAAADVASRVLQASLINPLGDLPTGFLGAISTVWNSGLLTLTSAQDGVVFADHGRSGVTDNGIVAPDDGAANPSPFPFLVTEGDNYQSNFTTGSLNANDLDSIYALQESWVIEL